MNTKIFNQNYELDRKARRLSRLKLRRLTALFMTKTRPIISLTNNAQKFGNHLGGVGTERIYARLACASLQSQICEKVVILRLPKGKSFSNLKSNDSKNGFKILNWKSLARVAT